MSNGNGHRWSKFWWADWRSDHALKLCSLAARGLWMELLCLMHESSGYLLVNNSPPTHEQLEQICGRTRQREIVTLMAELEQANVFSRTPDGIIFSRRMVRDFKASEAGRDAVSKRWNGADPNRLPNRSPNTPPIRSPITKKLEAEAEEERETPVGVSVRARAKKHRHNLPEDWKPGPKELALGAQHGFQPDEIAHEAERMRDWAAAKAAAYADWDAFFRNWLRDAILRRREQPATAATTTTDQLRREWNLPTFLGPKPGMLS